MLENDPVCYKVFWVLDAPKHAATNLNEDNDVCNTMAMGNIEKPTTHMRHMDIHFSALAEWVRQDLLGLERIPTSVNEADHLTFNNYLTECCFIDTMITSWDVPHDSIHHVIV
jgi:hypothetical protein